MCGHDRSKNLVPFALLPQPGYCGRRCEWQVPSPPRCRHCLSVSLSHLIHLVCLVFSPLTVAFTRAMPSSLVTAYEDLLVHNLSAVRSVESALRNVTWLLPGRFEDAELASEGRE
jgi:hypothetical protein